ncbi:MULTISPECIES: flagellar biosynthesis anti-sigma factor FlgM [Helicobacter]|uniref:Flagellar biosynthesis anti-sigma factor FlgM n=1 Tax=Helicobacter ibis TaxID=2962633 RepID=A0ABT4VDN7_9HELI|nr:MULTISPECIES: flagellar biosynthesis anti-sigma factor FlgM [Helicobacter]MDA3967535.1 flagellar biosynthesis anti-sigma factor FlgM [Helicobacter sp. WB40]MDA3968283.1 flagellar biosynthesis anti-sigma factor FlgM [Helicobacter ibis]
MISNLMSNSSFSSAVNQANNKNNVQQNGRVEQSDSEKKADSTKGSSRVDDIKKAIADGSYKIDLRGSAEKMAQDLLS